LCVGGPLDRISAHVDEIVPVLLAETADLSRKIGNSAPEIATLSC
jgi:hypothetical protein